MIDNVKTKADVEFHLTIVFISIHAFWCDI